MKKLIILFSFLFFTSFFSNSTYAQCSICSKTVMQMGTKPAEGFNTGIIYLMAIPYLAVGVLGYKWYRSNQNVDKDE